MWQHCAGTVLGCWRSIDENVITRFHAVADRPIAFTHLAETA